MKISNFSLFSIKKNTLKITFFSDIKYIAPISSKYKTLLRNTDDNVVN